jgi:hypothetical protein
MKNAPILTVLDLWSLGHSAAEVADMLGFPNGKHVTRIVEKARSIGDKRAVLHVSSTGRMLGRPGRMARPPVAIAVPSITALRLTAPKPRKVPRPRTRKLFCKRGHPRNAKTIDSNWGCRLCDTLRHRERR